MQYTQNYQLKKPEETDDALISDINENMDAIDGELAGIRADSLSPETAALYGLGEDAVPDEVFAAQKGLLDSIASVANGAAKIATGSYTGTDTYGSGGAVSLTFEFAPKLFILFYSEGLAFGRTWPMTGAQDYQLICTTEGLTTSYTSQGTSGFMAGIYYRYDGSSQTSVPNFAKKSADGRTLSWYNTQGPSYQYNTAGTVYRYIAIG